MAKVKFGMMMVDASGKLGGQVFSKNRSGSYVRTKVTPSNPQSFAQQEIRAILGAISASWSGLTALQRASWNGAVDAWKKTDIFGDLKNPTGKNLFTALNINLENSGQAQILVAPDKVEVEYMGVLSAVFVLADTELGFTVTNVPTTGECIVSATPPLSQGTSFYKGKYRQIAVTEASGITSIDLFNQYVAKFGTPAVGANISFQFKIIYPNGQASVPETIKAVVGA